MTPRTSTRKLEKLTFSSGVAMNKRWMEYSDLPFANEPEGICRWCGGECAGRRKTWCSKKCVAAYELRSDPRAVRRALRKRDKGICAGCGLDAIALKRQLKGCVEEQRAIIYPYGFTRPKDVKRSLWEAAHIVGVAEGGGCCDLDNYKTLCVPCHRAETSKDITTRAKKKASTKTSTKATKKATKKTTKKAAKKATKKAAKKAVKKTKAKIRAKKGR